MVSADLLQVYRIFADQIANTLRDAHRWYQRDRSIETQIRLENLHLLKLGFSLSEAESLPMQERREYTLLGRQLETIEDYKSKVTMTEVLIVGNAHIKPSHKRKISMAWRTDYTSATRELNRLLHLSSSPIRLPPARNQRPSTTPLSMSEFLARRRHQKSSSSPATTASEPSAFNKILQKS